MLRLKNVSKFYYNKGVIASGFSKVNITLDIGEFVAIVGESGSGKSTLLNVISGLDSYEEGEMYIDGQETSHYRENDFEEYRKKYVANIFQNFNLVNSYTVYQNVELVLLLNGYKKKEVKKKILDILSKVGLSKYKNTLASKLSGGQKQRVAIARALAKDSPIIVCDEPTGNLDSKSAKDIIKLLSDISKDRLVIVVTHNLSEIENLATRIVRMHDGRIVSDKKVKEVEKKDSLTIPNNKNIGLFNIFRLGVRNTFNIIPKFILIFIVFLFITVSLLNVYGSFQKAEYEEEKMGYNYYFNDLDDKRIVIRKKDNSEISDDDIEKIMGIEKVSMINKDDILIDQVLWFQSESGESYLDGIFKDIDSFNEKLDYGKMPEDNNQVILEIARDNYYFGTDIERVIDRDYYLNGDKDSEKIRIVGIRYIDDYMENAYIYGKRELIKKFLMNINRENSKVLVKINDIEYNSYNSYGDDFSLIPTDRVASGCAYVSENINYACPYYDCMNKYLNISVENLYYKDNKELKICNVYNQWNVFNLLGIKTDDKGYRSIYINRDDYNNLFNRNSYQASVYVSDGRDTSSVSLELEKNGYRTLEIKKALNDEGTEIARILKIIKLVVIIGMVITLFFISYFVIKLILKSRNVYFSTLRILGGSYKQVKRIMDVELFVNASLAYFIYMMISLLVYKNVIDIRFIASVLGYLKISDYIIIYLILIMMSYLISTRFSSKIFKQSAMKSYREEV